MLPTKILIAEDEILIARKIEATLHQLGYSVTAIANDGESAIQQVADTRPDLVLMDILMPGEIDGIEAATQIRHRFQVPVVYLTAYGDSDTVSKAKLSQPFGYLLKPFQPRELDTTIQVALVRHQTEQMRLSTLRSNISASLPHEINTPLSGILGFTNLLIKYYDSFSKADALEMLEGIRTSAIRLDRICQNVLLYAKLELIAADPERLTYLKQAHTFATEPLIRTQAIQKAQEVGRTGDLKMNLDNAPVPMSETYFLKLVEELLDNAFKFSTPATPVQVISSQMGKYLVLSVRNQGRGLTGEQVAELGAYMQFDRDRHEQQGMGLGLSLVRRLVELHGGELIVESVVDAETTFTIKLPILMLHADGNQKSDGSGERIQHEWKD